MVSAAYLQAFLDKIEASYRNTDAPARQTVLATMTPVLVGGDGTPGHTTYGAGDLTFITKMASPLLAMQAAARPDVIQQAIYNTLFQTLNGYLAANAPAGQGTLDPYLTAQNATTPYTRLIGPNTADLYWLFLSGGQRGDGTLLTPANVYSPQVGLGSATVAAGGGGTFTPGSSVRTANVTGPTPLQGYAPAVGAFVTVTAPINGTLTIQAVVTGVSSTGAPVTGQAWTAVLDNLAVGATVALSPPAGISGQRIVQVTACGAKPGTSPTATSGAFSLTSSLERNPT